MVKKEKLKLAIAASLAYFIGFYLCSAILSYAGGFFGIGENLSLMVSYMLWAISVVLLVWHYHKTY
jgi:hypothetical protein